MNTAAVAALAVMTDSAQPIPPPDALDQLVEELLAIGGVLSQMISHMVASQASGRSAPDAAPIPEVAHSLIRSALTGVSERHLEDDIEAAACVVREATDAICEEIYLVPPGEFGQARRRSATKRRRTGRGSASRRRKRRR